MIKISKMINIFNILKNRQNEQLKSGGGEGDFFSRFLKEMNEANNLLFNEINWQFRIISNAHESSFLSHSGVILFRFHCHFFGEIEFDFAGIWRFSVCGGGGGGWTMTHCDGPAAFLICYSVVITYGIHLSNRVWSIRSMYSLRAIELANSPQQEKVVTDEAEGGKVGGIQKPHEKCKWCILNNFDIHRRIRLFSFLCCSIVAMTTLAPTRTCTQHTIKKQKK